MNFRILFFFLVTIGLNSQTNKKQVSFRDLTVKDGLSQNSVVSIAQDSIGYLWFATQDGLNKYDGRTFTYYNKQYQDVTRSSYAQLGQVYTDTYGDLWSYSSNSIIEKYNYKTQVFDSICKVNSATVLFRKNQNTLWVGTLYSGMFEVDLESKLVIPLFEKQLEKLSVFEIKRIDDSIYLGTSKGVFSVKNDNLKSIPTTKDFAVSSIIKHNEDLVFGTYGNSVQSINLNTKTLGFKFASRFSNNLNVQDIFLDSKSRLWIATYGDGLHLLDSKDILTSFKANKEDPFALNYNDILKVYEDMTGNIWFGTDGAGLNYYDEHLVKFNTLTSKQVPDNISVDVIRSIAVDSLGTLWLGTSGKGLTQINKENNYYKTLTTENSILSSDRIMSLLLVDNNLWIGHQTKGLQILYPDGQFQSFKDLSNQSIWKIFKDTKNNIWLCTRTEGILKFDSDRGVLESYNQSNSILPNNIRTLEQVNDNELWIGTDNQGLYKFDMISKDIENINQIEDKIKSLCYVDSLLWIGTNGEGIKSLNPKTRELKLYVNDYDLPNKVIYALLPDDNGNLWVSTNKGISRFSPNDPNKHYVENYSIINGLQEFEFNTGAYFKGPDGQLYFGGIEGVNWFNPNTVSYNEIIPKTIISKFEVFGKEQQIIQKKTFKYNENTMTFTFAGLHFSHPEKNFYRYQLENHDKDWTFPEFSNVAHYTNLPPNEYTFKVMSSNYEGIWNKVPTTFTFKILKPWYATNLLLSIYGFLVLLTIYAIYRYFRFRWEVKTQLRLEHAETERLKKLDEFKTKLYTNISHEFRTPLTLISGPVDKQLERDDLLEENKKDLTLVKQNANRLLNLVNQMIDLSLVDSGQLSLKIVKGNLSVLLNQIVEAFQYKSQEKHITIDATINKIDTAYFDKDIIEKVVSNLLTNAIKYSPEESHISFDASQQENALVIAIVNHYNKVASRDLSKLFQRFYQDDEATEGIGVGLALVKELISLAKGTIIANNIDNNKIQFTVTLPINKESFTTSEIIDSLIAPIQDENSSNTEINNTTTILVVEDQNDVREFVASVFNNNYEVITANNGEAGIKKATKNLPDLIISDIMMPVKNGIELCNSIKQDRLTSHIPVILLTAKVGEENEIEGLKSGADAYITKPFNSKLLLVEVDRLIKSRQQLKELYSKEFIVNPDLAITSTETEFLKRLQTVLDAHITDPEFKSERMGELLQMSRTQLHRKLKSVYGLSTSEFIRTQRLKLSLQLLKESDATISEIAYQVGFNSPSYYIKCFKETYNSTPSDYYN